MAFDQSTRNRLQKFVNDARTLLTEEFTRQLQATFGLDPKAGSVADIDSLTHLDNQQRKTAHILRDTLAHYLTTTHGKGEVDRSKQALSRVVREQAFTVLNRLAALRMAEARGFLLESIAKGYNSKGFQLYKQLAGSAQGETGEAYSNYLYSVFDEFSLDLAVLFDRHSAQGRLFPRESALLELLDLINHYEIEPLWAEDETIGWIYQYFNSQEERKKMRAESQAPRNSRELAVRNQFFTPRYVVEFLTDNTLGRIWYEMTQGNTGLVESCRYLVRRPTEVFLKPGEQAPEQAEAAGKEEALSQEELLKQPVYITHRAIKDPRCIRMLDPACGSMHFGLYAFDLYERIYEEAWQLEAELGAEAFVREGDLKPLHQTHDSFEDYRAEIPRLIIEHNIHGVDIDPRAVQIAGLSLWQRAQRAWQQQGIKPQQRPVVKKSNIVCAEPMPGEKVLLQEFANSLNPPVLGQLLEAIFDKMELAGEAGTLLKIEEEIQSSIHEARSQWQARSGSNSVGDMFQAELDQATPQRKLGFDLSGVDDESFWDGAEQLILDALSNYADKAESNADQKRLFAEDAAKGFAFIDLCRKRFDVVLMNPPFGDPSESYHSQFKKLYSHSNGNLLCGFIERSNSLIHEKGFVGALTDRTWLQKTTYEDFRYYSLFGKHSLQTLIDLGVGILDNAQVEACISIFVLNEKNVLFASDLRKVGLEVKSSALLESIAGENQKKIKTIDRDIFNSLPDRAIAHWCPSSFLNLFKTGITIHPTVALSKRGVSAGDTTRAFRLLWEVPQENIGIDRRWAKLQNGGKYSPYYRDTRLVSWYENNFHSLSPLKGARLQNLDFVGRKGLTWAKRTEFISVSLMTENHTFTDEGQALFPIKADDYWSLMGILNSRAFQYGLNLFCGQHKSNGYVGKLKVTDQLLNNRVIRELSEEAYNLAKSISVRYEPNSEFISPWAGLGEHRRFKKAKEIIQAIYNEDKLVSQRFEVIQSELDQEVDGCLCLSPEELDLIYEATNNRPVLNSRTYTDIQLDESSYQREHSFSIISFFFGYLFGRWSMETINSIGVSEKGANSSANCRSLKNIVIDVDSDDCSNLIRCFESAIKEYGWINSSFDDFFHGTILDSSKIHSFFADPTSIFEYHFKKYSFGKGLKNCAPIYWPLQTPSVSYTLWVYYHRLNEQTLYACVNDFVQPKLEKIEQDLNTLLGKSARSTQEEKELEKLSDLASELRDFRDELLRLAKLWKPNLNDGVQVTAAPLWKLFQHKAWQKKLKETWESLEKGDYDWAHLACSIWPERVLSKCHQDRSLAIAHDVEKTFWHEVEVPVMRGKKATGKTKLEWQPKDLSEKELSALIQQIITGMK